MAVLCRLQLHRILLLSFFFVPPPLPPGVGVSLQQCCPPPSPHPGLRSLGDSDGCWPQGCTSNRLYPQHSSGLFLFNLQKSLIHLMPKWSWKFKKVFLHNSHCIFFFFLGSVGSSRRLNYPLALRMPVLPGESTFHQRHAQSHHTNRTCFPAYQLYKPTSQSPPSYPASSGRRAAEPHLRHEVQFSRLARAK